MGGLSYLVIRTPRYCSECPLCMQDRYCWETGCKCNETDEIPEWCPLIEVKYTNTKTINIGGEKNVF